MYICYDEKQLTVVRDHMIYIYIHYTHTTNDITCDGHKRISKQFGRIMFITAAGCVIFSGRYRYIRNDSNNNMMYIRRRYIEIYRVSGIPAEIVVRAVPLLATKFSRKLPFRKSAGARDTK